MDAETRARNRAEVVSEVSKWTVGGGILVHHKQRTIDWRIALPVMLIRKLARSASRLWRPRSGQRPPERSARPATGH